MVPTRTGKPAVTLARIATCILAGAATWSIAVGTSIVAPASASVEVFFSPGGNADHAVASAMNAAQRRVWLAGYYFTSAPIAKALHEAKVRGVDVRIVLDRSQASVKYSSARFFYNQGVPIRISVRYPVMHHKVVVIDDVVGFGSMNFTRRGAQQNAENFNLFRQWPALVQTYAGEFERLERESVPYRPGMVFDGLAAGSERTE